jgi:enoyl-[acyl-carrier protein] reductase II
LHQRRFNDRLIKNDFYNRVQQHYSEGATIENLKELLGRGRAKKGMFEGDLVEGELEIGQISGLINEIKTAGQVVEDLVSEFRIAQEEISRITL